MNYNEVLQVLREEAQEIKDFCAQAKCTSDRDKKLLEAFEVVDKALKAEPCEDAISRKAVMNLYQKYRPSLATHVSEFGDALNSLPPVTPLKSVKGFIKRIETLDHVWVFNDGLTATDKRDIVINAIKEYFEVTK